LPATVAISVIAGTAGVGKSALAIHAAHRLADRFPDGQLYANLQGAAQVRPLPASTGCAVLVTSRRVLSSLEGAAHLHLDVLSAADAVELLGRLAGDPRVAAEPTAAGEVAHWCGYLPLALRIAGARLAARPRWRGWRPNGPTCWRQALRQPRSLALMASSSSSPMPSSGSS
jgi:hypothetical protein